ncbi:hypothetical protein SETIT_3G317700v2 [Setaria italica]|uniref:Uncharacterized protein n=1 Tax=Setaria italica TaxID=4555 RepID=A0A368QKY5_SETIT|nr:hypothetical protein SETIT_3G317700v2 [Setaria italica]
MEMYGGFYVKQLNLISTQEAAGKPYLQFTLPPWLLGTAAVIPFCHRHQCVDLRRCHTLGLVKLCLLLSIRCWTATSAAATQVRTTTLCGRMSKDHSCSVQTYGGDARE